MPTVKFTKDKTYKLGVLTKASENTPKFPEFINYPKPVSLHGHYLIDELGINTFSDYLKINPNSYPINKIITCFEIDKNGNLKKLDEGNPYPKAEKQASNLNDNPLSQQIYPNTKSVDKEVIKVFTDQIEQQRGYISSLQSELQKYQEKIISLETEKAEMQGDLTKLTIERDTYQKVIDEVSKGNEGLGDGANMLSKFGESLAGILQQPEVQQIVGGLFARIGNKFAPQGKPQMQQTAYNPNVNTDGIATKPGEFNENPL